MDMASSRPIARVDDVAAYILAKVGPMTTMKLQKLVYYAQAWSLVFNERPLFSNRIEAWANGPVIPFLYRKHREQFIVDAWPEGRPDNLEAEAIKTTDPVIKFYGYREAAWLSELTHIEKPWLDARKGLQPGEPSKAEITWPSMHEYYGSLVGHGKA